jgi:hypothetical protein
MRAWSGLRDSTRIVVTTAGDLARVVIPTLAGERAADDDR